MKRFVFLFMFLLFVGVSVCHAQTKIAEFPGGIQAMQKFIAENLRYPAESLNNGSQGKTVLRFVVERDGSITNVEALKYSGDPLLDKEAIRVASVMPKWNPAYEDGTPIRTYYSLPITFKLQSEVQEKEEYIKLRKWIIENYDPYNDGKVAHRMLEGVRDYIRRNGVPKKRKVNLWRKYTGIKTFGNVKRK